MANKMNNKANTIKKVISTSSELNPEDIVSIVNKKVEDEVNKIKIELNDYKAKIIEVLAIFVALFTFVSFDIQIFKSDLSVFSILGFTLIMLGALIFFIILLRNLLSDKKNLGFILIAISLIIVGILSIGVSDVKTKKTFDDYYKKSEIDKSFNITSQSMIDFKNCLKLGGWNQCFK